MYIEDFTIPRESATISRLGGKGYNLVQLSNIAQNVPYGFVVCEESFREYCKPWISAVTIKSDNKIDDSTIDMLQDQFNQKEFSKELVEEIQQHLTRLISQSPLSSPLLAVRSSGIAEDLDTASFAGMNDSVLNVRADISSVCQAIKCCWKSLFSRRSIEYRVKQGFSVLDTSIAVVVQIMIPSEKSGVVFTVDSQTGSRCHLCIDGVVGMGEALVSGQVNTDHWKIRKPFGDHSWQAYKLVSNYPQEGTTQVDLSEEEGSTACFSKEELDQIVTAAMAIESHYKKPMDIEFTFYNQTLYILQARPITHLLQIPDSVNPIIHPDAREWGIFINIGYFQMLTDPFTPMGYSTILQVADVSEKYLLYMNGFLYMDLSGFMETWLFRYLTVSKFRTMADEELAQILTEVYKKESKAYSHARAKHAKKGITKNFFMPMVKLLAGLYRQKLDPVGLEEKILGIYNEELAIEEKILNENSDNSIERVFEVPFDAVRLMCMMKGYMQFATRKYNTIIKLVKQAGLDEADAEKLWQAPEENIANRYNNLIIKVGKMLKKKALEAKVGELVQHENKEEVYDWVNQLREEENEDSRELVRLWDQLMKEFGCRCHREIDVGAQRYSDIPYRVLEMALNVADGEITVESEMKKKREEALQFIRENVKPRVFKKIEKLLPTASLFMKYREHQKYAFIRILNAYHEAFLRKGARLVEMELLEKEDDIFYLQLEDVLHHERGEVDGKEFKQKVRNARHVMDSATSFTMPRVFCKPEGLMVYLSNRTYEQLQSLPENVLKGMPTSAGVVEGTAVVGTDPHSTVIRPGEILVAKATDPSWTPLFSTAAAVAIEIGGPLTHGSVVAKELGIPCVVGIPNLTNKIQSGMRIRVDGSKGTVEILYCVCYKQSTKKNCEYPHPSETPTHPHQSHHFHRTTFLTHSLLLASHPIPLQTVPGDASALRSLLLHDVL